MKIIIDHDNCEHADGYSDRCLRNTILHPLAHERHCMRRMIEDGNKALTVVLIQDGKKYTRVFLAEDEREIAAEEGYAYFMREARVEDAE